MTKHDLPVLARLGEDLHRAAVREIGRPPWWRRRRVAFAVPALGAAALVAALVVPGGAGPGAAERAYAAVTPGDEILHVITQTTTRVDDERRRTESWTDGERARTLASAEGGAAELRHERIVDDDRVTVYSPQRDELRTTRVIWDGSGPPPDQPEVFAQRLERGEFDAPREDTFDGRRVVRFDLVREMGTLSWFLDADTFASVATRLTAADGQAVSTTRYLLYERVPHDDRLLAMSPHPGADRSDGPPVGPDFP